MYFNLHSFSQFFPSQVFFFQRFTYNQLKLKAAAKRMNEGKGTVHELMEDIDD